jgi:hypothetical protein
MVPGRQLWMVVVFVAVPVFALLFSPILRQMEILLLAVEVLESKAEL